ncbi:hypothetical protein DRO26_03950, partial [Candidatus Bathyarchaeota archaeon]
RFYGVQVKVRIKMLYLIKFHCFTLKKFFTSWITSNLLVTSNHDSLIYGKYKIIQEFYAISQNINKIFAKAKNGEKT